MLTGLLEHRQLECTHSHRPCEQSDNLQLDENAGSSPSPSSEHDLDHSSPTTTFSELTDPPSQLSHGRSSSLEPNAGLQNRPADNCSTTLPRDDRGIVQDNPTLRPEEQEAAQALSHIHDLAFDCADPLSRSFLFRQRPY